MFTVIHFTLMDFILWSVLLVSPRGQCLHADTREHEEFPFATASDIALCNVELCNFKPNVVVKRMAVSSTCC